LWLLVNRPEDKRESSLAEQRRMEFGTEFGREVTRLFPGGVEMTADYRHPQEALVATASLLQGDAPALFEAAFLHHDVLIRADILKRSQADPRAWELIEVNTMNSTSIRVFLLFSPITLASFGQQAEQAPATLADSAAADTVYTNGKIYTVNKAQSWAVVVSGNNSKNQYVKQILGRRIHD
jgi:hypothetical protein